MKPYSWQKDVPLSSSEAGQVLVEQELALWYAVATVACIIYTDAGEIRMTANVRRPLNLKQMKIRGVYFDDEGECVLTCYQEGY